MMGGVNKDAAVCALVHVHVTLCGHPKSWHLSSLMSSVTFLLQPTIFCRTARIK